MKKIFLGLSVVFTALMSAQVYYPTNGSPSYNDGYYNNYEDDFYFPDDYYYEYPADYYTNSYYTNYYNDYRRSIQQVNWNRFFSMYRLAPWQIQQIMMLNDQFANFNSWNNFYRYNPDRWYYDRFYALERILGPRVFVIFQNNYYNGYNPIVYYQYYRRQHYRPQVYVVQRYRNVNVNRYRVDRVKYHQSNPRQNIGFRDNPRVSNNANGFRNGVKPEVKSNTRFRNDNTATAPKSETRSFRTQTPDSNQNNSGFRNNSAPRTTAPERSIQRSESPKSSSPSLRTPSTNRTSGMRLTSI